MPLDDAVGDEVLAHAVALHSLKDGWRDPISGNTFAALGRQVSICLCTSSPGLPSRRSSTVPLNARGGGSGSRGSRRAPIRRR